MLLPVMAVQASLFADAFDAADRRVRAQIVPIAILAHPDPHPRQIYRMMP
jgi:hypothetical protein